MNNTNNMMAMFPYKISLGANCYMKLHYFNMAKISQPTDYFDYVGSSAWSLAELLENDFSGHVDNIEYIQSTLNEWMFANTRYNIRFKHDFDKKYKTLESIPQPIFEEFQEKYERRKDRFINALLDTKKPILFFRAEEYYKPTRQPHGLISTVYPSDSEKIPDFEYANYAKFCSIVKKRYRRNFATIYVSQKPNSVDLENNIIVVHNDKYEEWHKTSIVNFIKLFNKNKSFIDNGLKQIMNNWTNTNKS